MCVRVHVHGTCGEDDLFVYSEVVVEEVEEITKSSSPDELSSWDLFSGPRLQTLTLRFLGKHPSLYLTIHPPNFKESLFAFRSLKMSPTVAFGPAGGNSSPLGDYNCGAIECWCWKQSERASGPRPSFLTEEESEG